MYIDKKDKELAKELKKISKWELDKTINKVEKIIKKVGNYSLLHFSKPRKITSKGPRDIVTDVDVKCEKMIRSYLEKHFKDYGFCGEESTGDYAGKDFYWVVDPIDGTTNFAHGFEAYCVSIALTYKGIPILGVIYSPVKKAIYKAHIKSKAYKNNKIINVSKIKKLEHSLIVLGFYYNFDTNLEERMREFENVLLKVQSIRRDGSAALNLCYVAEGVCDAFYETSLHAWDVAAGIIIANQAGATITKKDGSSYYDIFSRDTIVVSNQIIHKDICKLLNS